MKRANETRISMKAITAAIVDGVLACILTFLILSHMHVTVQIDDSGVILPSSWLYTAILLVMILVTLWWLLSRRKR